MRLLLCRAYYVSPLIVLRIPGRYQPLQLLEENELASEPLLAGVEYVEVGPARDPIAGVIVSVPDDRLCAAGLDLVDQRAHALARQIDDEQPDALRTAARGEVVANRGLRVEGVGYILVQRERQRRHSHHRNLGAEVIATGRANDELVFVALPRLDRRIHVRA